MSPSDASTAQSLDLIVQSSISLLKQLQGALAEIHRTPTTTTSEPSSSTSNVDILSVARDSVSLLRAHSTKLSVLIVNEPFTPKEIIAVIRDLAGGAVPNLAASVDQCHPAKYTAAVRRELAWRCRAVLVELGNLLEKIPQDGKALSSTKEGFSDGDKGSIALTGLLWSACDQVVALCNGGAGEFLAKKVGQWTDTLEDVMEELREWGDEEPDDEDDDDDDDDEEDDAHEGDIEAANGTKGPSASNDSRDAYISAQNLVDEMMNPQTTIPRDDPDQIRPRLESALKRIRLVTLLYRAIVKNRIKKLPAAPFSSSIATRLDEAANVLMVLSDRFGDLACAFYELQPDEIDPIMDQCFLDAFAAGELLSLSWDGKRDNFTEWVEKFQVHIKKDASS